MQGGRKRWKKIKKAQREKLTLKRKRVQAVKLEAKTTLIKAKNDGKSFKLIKIMKNAKILSVLLADMDPLTKSIQHFQQIVLAYSLD
jgi:hypothetical protein